jgi:hypothetical protein
LNQTRSVFFDYFFQVFLLILSRLLRFAGSKQTSGSLNDGQCPFKSWEKFLVSYFVTKSNWSLLDICSQNWCFFTIGSRVMSFLCRA